MQNAVRKGSRLYSNYRRLPKNPALGMVGSGSAISAFSPQITTVFPIFTVADPIVFGPRGASTCKERRQSVKRRNYRFNAASMHAQGSSNLTKDPACCSSKQASIVNYKRARKLSVPLSSPLFSYTFELQ